MIFRRFLAALLLLQSGLGAVKDIHKDKLPNDPAIQNAFLEASELEPMTSFWDPNWRFELSKGEVAKRLSKISAQLRDAEKQNPENVELHLLSGLVAHYGYNVDVEGSYEAAMAGFGAAEKLAPADIRAQWFRAIHVCQTTQPADGVKTFLELEKSRSARELPATFWYDYMECTLPSDLAVHALRAADHFFSLHGDTLVGPQLTTRVRQLAAVARARREQPNGTKEYEAREAWRATPDESAPRFSNEMCGISLAPLGAWRLPSMGVQKGICMFLMETGPHGNVIPNIFVLARQKKPNETLEQFAAVLLSKSKDLNHAIDIAHCPVDKCLGVGAVRPGGYKQNGDAVMKSVFFAREAPEYSGLILEEPDFPGTPGPAAKDVAGGKISYYRPAKRYLRFEGTIFYAVMLDTASSVERDATADFEQLLKSVTVE